MIKIDKINIKTKEFVKTYSDAGLYIRQEDSGDLYEEALDPVDSGRSYIETDFKIPVDEEAEA